jgi:hypothetical protein
LNGSSGEQSIVEIGDEILDVFNTDTETNEILW